jgi:hypothetical protein
MKDEKKQADIRVGNNDGTKDIEPLSMEDM